MENKEVHNVIILGSGCAGLTAAIYSARAQLKPIVMEGNQVGGQLSLTSDIENFPGFEKGVDSFSLLSNMRNQAIRFGAKFITEIATNVEFDEKSKIKKITTANGKTFLCKSLIVATGASARMLKLENEDELIGKGLHTCATCDGFFYRGKEVVVVGGGDTALEEALFLTRFATKVYLVHRRDKFRASKIMSERVKANKNIQILWNTVVTKYIKDEKEGKLNGVILQNTISKQTKAMKIDGVFLAIGHIPNTSFLKGLVDLDREGYIKTIEHQVTTKVEGIFAAGDCADKVFQQAITAAGLGCSASIISERFLAEKFQK